MQSSGGKKKDARSVIEGVKRQSAARAKKEDQKRLIYAGLGLIAIIVLVIIIAVASSGKKADETLAEPSASPTAIPTPTPVPTVGPTPQPEVYLPVVEHASISEKRIAITIDDLNEVDNLNEIISIAESNNGKLTLFAIGRNVTEKSDLQATLRRAYNNGLCEIENHTYDHAKLYSMDDAGMAYQIYMTQMAVNKALGIEYEMHFLRMPGGNGEYDLRTHQYLVQLGGYKAIADWTYSGSNASISNIKKNLKPGSIYLFHCKAEDLKKLKEFIPYAVSQGYQLVTLNNLLGYEENAVSPLKTDAMSYEIPAPLPFVYTNYVTLGNKNYKQLYAVQLLQQRLIDLGFLASDSKVDGDFGSSTKRAVELFQAAAGLKVDGYAGAETQKFLFSDVAPRNTGNEVAGQATAAPAQNATGADQPFGGTQGN